MRRRHRSPLGLPLPPSDRRGKTKILIVADINSNCRQPRGRQAGGPGWADGSGRFSWAASAGSTLRAEAVQYSPLGLRQSSRSHTPRPRAVCDSWPSCKASRSQAIVCGRKMRSPTRTPPVLHRTPRRCQVCPVASQPTLNAYIWGIFVIWNAISIIG